MSYEHFTDRARNVMLLANQEAKRLAHDYLGTEHILLGLVKEGSGVAAHVLKNLDIDLNKIRLEVEMRGPLGTRPVAPGKLPQMPHARRVVEEAINQARIFSHTYVGTEHLLLGLLAGDPLRSVALRVLSSLGLSLEKVREEILLLLGHKALDQPAPNIKDVSWDTPPENIPQQVIEATAAAFTDTRACRMTYEGPEGGVPARQAFAKVARMAERDRILGLIGQWIEKYKASPRPEVAAALLQIRKEIERGEAEASPR